MGHNLPIAVLVGIIGGLSGQAAAATDGDIGPTSQGSLQISLRIAPQVRLSNLRDLRLESEGFERVSAQRDLCIYSRTGQYQLQAQGSGNGAAFILTQAGLDTEPYQRTYQVQYDDGAGLKSLATGVSLNGLSGADTDSPTCNTTGLNGQLLISSKPIPGQIQQAGHYQGTLTLLVAPE